MIQRRSNAGRPLYAVVGPNNEVLAVEKDEGSAVRAGYSMTDNVFVDESADLPDFREENPLGARGPEVAHRRVNNLVIRMRDVEKMSVQEAHAKLVGLFPTERTRKSGELETVDQWQTPNGMVRALIAGNDKTKKKDLLDYQQRRLTELFPGKDTISIKGLTLLPNVMYSKVKGQRGRTINTCVGASKECIASCLVYSGRNDMDVYNVKVKFAKTNALFREPVAFGRILLQACINRENSHTSKGEIRGLSAFMTRLNIFSDIPWEMVFPELFTAVPALPFYDYTKVTSRRTPDNYDLTFSYSGRNLDDVVGEVGRGKRVAVVFLTEEHRFPATFLGYPVVDGVLTDARPLDPSPSIVGLMYIPPLKAAQKAMASPETSVFIVPVEEIDGVLVASVVPRDQPGVQQAAESMDVAPEGSVVEDEGSTSFIEGLVPANTLVRRASPSVNTLKSKLLR